MGFVNHSVASPQSTNRVNALLPAASVRQALLHQAACEVDAFFESIDDLAVRPEVSPGEIRSWLERFDFAQPHDATNLVGEIANRMKSWGLHTPHPRYFGLFNPAPGILGVVADTLVAGFNPQLGAWHHHPFGVEVEAHLVKFFCSRFGLGESGFGNFTTGGSEANFSAVVVALTRIFPDVVEKGVRGVDGHPVIYCSAEFHHSFIKIAHQCGLGRKAVRLVPVTPECVMDVAKLEEMIEADRHNGLAPFLVVATAGTTNAGLVEPLGEIGDIARREKLHFHVDAAWGGGAILSEKHKSALAGIETADSITFDPHKLLSVPMGAGMFLVRNRKWLSNTFGLQTDYVPSSPTQDMDNYQLSVQFSRRFIGLKLFMTLSALGREGLATAIDRQFDMALVLARKLESAGFEVVNGASLGVVCFAPPVEWGYREHSQFERHADRVCETGQAWISSTKLGGRPVFRACITNHLTQPTDLDQMIELLLSVR